ncbi:MAG: glycosyltransferase family 2 protein [Massilia sp.]
MTAALHVLFWLCLFILTLPVAWLTLQVLASPNRVRWETTPARSAGDDWPAVTNRDESATPLGRQDRLVFGHENPAQAAANGGDSPACQNAQQAPDCRIARHAPACQNACNTSAAVNEQAPADGHRPTLVVLVPAHNEAMGIGATLASITAQLLPGDRLVVIADNCNDDTAMVAHLCGAEVAVRADPDRRGKGYALAFGIRHLHGAPPEVVIVVDADCLLAPSALDLLARACAASGRPVQAQYLMFASDKSTAAKRVAEFAWTVKNALRPLGALRLGQGCQLTGSGMALPWRLARVAPLDTPYIVEDLKLGLDLALLGAVPLFCPRAVVTSVFPDNAAGSAVQRTRWEHGHLGLIAAYGPKLAAHGLLRRDLAQVTLALDLCVPPVSLLLMLTLAGGAAGLVGAKASGEALPWALAAIPPAALCAVLILTWHKCGRDILPSRQLGHVLVYAVMKIPLYLRFLIRRQVAWLGAARDK